MNNNFGIAESSNPKPRKNVRKEKVQNQVGMLLTMAYKCIGTGTKLPE